MLGVGRAAAVAEEKQLAAVPQGVMAAADQRLERLAQHASRFLHDQGVLCELLCVVPGKIHRSSSALSSPLVVVVEALDVVLAEIVARLHLDHEERLLADVLEA